MKHPIIFKLLHSPSGRVIRVSDWKSPEAAGPGSLIEETFFELDRDGNWYHTDYSFSRIDKMVPDGSKASMIQAAMKLGWKVCREY